MVNGSNSKMNRIGFEVWWSLHKSSPSGVTIGCPQAAHWTSSERIAHRRMPPVRLKGTYVKTADLSRIDDKLLLGLLLVRQLQCSFTLLVLYWQGCPPL
jgi:hypothetical protein